MRKILKSALSLIIIIAVILSAVTSVLACEQQLSHESIAGGHIVSDTYMAAVDFDPNNYTMDDRDVVALLRSTMAAAEPQVTVRFASHTMHNLDSLKVVVDAWFEKAFLETGKPDEGDYIRYNYRGYITDIVNYWTDNGVVYYIIPFTINYYTNKEQEIQLDSEIKKVISSFNFTEKTTDKQKCDAIYDYITANVRYDYENVNKSEYTLKFSAYAALINKTAVCQGYASLFYRMASECGLRVRCISGTSRGQRHAWNIVKIGGYYYFLDATWDEGNEEYEYYLKGSEYFPSHTPDTEFSSNAFMREYPISKTSYSFGGRNENCQEGHTYEQFYEDDIEIRYTCAVCGDIKTDSKLPMGETLVKGADGYWRYYVDGVFSDATTLVKYSGKWFYVRDGVWERGAMVLFKYKGKWFYIENGKWNTKANLFFQIGEKAFYVVNGKWSSGITTLVKYNGRWLYVKNGKWSTDVGIVKYKGKKFFVNAGYAQLSYSGRVIIGGKFYKIKNGKVVS